MRQTATITKAWIWLAFAAAMPSGLARADAAKLAGYWQGTISSGGIDLGVVVHLTGAEGGWKATFDVPDQGAIGMPVDSVGIEGDSLVFALNALRASFRGKINAGQTEAVGEWTQAGRVTPLRLAKTETPTTLVVPKPLVGIWEGKLAIGGAGLRIGLRVETRPNGATVVGFASPDQGANFLPINAINLDGSKVRAESKGISANYVGTLNADRTEISGTWTQGKVVLPLVLKKTDRITAPNRPQTPKPPYPYQSVDVTYANTSAKIMLAGTLTMPKGKGPFPAVVMITGSGSQDRDETLFGHKPFLVIADALTRRGVAVLRVDDRGVGGSTGNPATATSEDYAGDVLAGLAYLKTRANIDQKALGLVGHSEGGLIAPIVAAKSGDVAFIVLLAGTGLDGRAILKSQNRYAFKAAGMSGPFLDRVDQTLDTLYDAVLTEKDAKAAFAKLQGLTEPFKSMTESEQTAAKVFTGKSLAAIVEQVNMPWYRLFLTYDPKANLAKVRCPVLAINGGMDMQVDAKTHLAAIAEALKAGGNTRVRVEELPGLNHLFQKSKTGSPAEYATIEETIDPTVLTLIGDWIVATTGRK